MFYFTLILLTIYSHDPYTYTVTQDNKTVSQDKHTIKQDTRKIAQDTRTTANFPVKTRYTNDNDNHKLWTRMILRQPTRKINKKINSRNKKLNIYKSPR